MKIWPGQVTTQQTEITFNYEVREIRESAPRFLFDYLTNTIKNTKASQGFYISPMCNSHEHIGYRKVYTR
jgi:hypothetical protein